jgi:TPR repeat protein
MRWLNLAAEKYYAPAMAQLGEIYWRGELQSQDHARGLMWYNLASESAREEANPEIFDRYEELYLTASDEERHLAEGLALQWKERNPLRGE